jgi:hypothetical protein
MQVRSSDTQLRSFMQSEFLCSFHDQLTCATESPRKIRRTHSGFGNKAIASAPLNSTVIAIFAKHSTLISLATIILKTNNRFLEI